MERVYTLLIIDDDDDDRSLFIEAVREINDTIRCLTANNGQEALTLLKSNEVLPDYIFLDLRMPGYNGKMFLSEIKKDQKLKDIPVVVYTTSTETRESKEMLNMGAVHFISKPSNPSEIYYVISHTLEEQLFNSLKNRL